MKAARYDGTPGITIREVPDPRPGAGEALIRVNRVGVCGNDPFIISGKNKRVAVPVIPGHEIVGTIEEVNDPGNSSLRPGDRVAVFPVKSCGTCAVCSIGEYQLCPSLRIIGAQVDGGYAELLAAPVRNLVNVPAKLTTEEAVMAEPLAVAVHGARIGQVGLGDAVAVIGGGPIGLLSAHVARRSGGMPVLITEVLHRRLAIARECGFEAIDASASDAVNRVLTRTAGGVDVVLECAGHAETISQIIAMGKPRSRAVVIGVFKEPAAVDLFALSKKEQRLTASWMYSIREFRKAVQLLAAGIVPVNRIVTHVLPLERVAEGLELVRQGRGAMKVVIEVS